jgi:hypothetical protein
MQGMAYQVIKQALVWTKQETPLSYEIENRILAGYVVSADTREAECNCIARLEYWKVILDSLFRSVILVQCSIIRKLNPWSILNWLDNIPSVYDIILSASVVLIQLF